jgi:predicted permease
LGGMRYALLACAFLAGFVLRERLERGYRTIYRTQALVLGGPLGFIAGWTFQASASSLVTLIALLATELTVITLAVRLTALDRISPVHAVSATSNSGFWSIPIAGTLFGPSGAAFAIVYDIIGVLRPLLMVRILRKSAPEPPSRTSALADYAPDAALLIGLGLNIIGHAPDVVRNVLSVMAVALGLVGFALLGAAMPDRPPRKANFLAALPVIPLRFAAPVTMCLILRAFGIDVPSAAWVIALAPPAFRIVALARLYGYERAAATAIPLIAVPLAAALVPVAAVLAR